MTYSKHTVMQAQSGARNAYRCKSKEAALAILQTMPESRHCHRLSYAVEQCQLLRRVDEEEFGEIVKMSQVAGYMQAWPTLACSSL